MRLQYTLEYQWDNGCEFKDFVSNQYSVHIHTLLGILTNNNHVFFKQYLFTTYPNTISNSQQATHEIQWSLILI